MGKYNFQLDLNTVNTMSIIANSIRENSYILEFGPANGRLTNYLHNALNCTVDIVEIDVESGKEASQYASIACIGQIEGNINGNVWYEKLLNNRYDYILFADVLEHLPAPQIVLYKCLKLLKGTGEVLVSIPNMAHNSIIINLINNQFIYTKFGLLDNTHIHFFTDKSFMNMVKQIGYSICEIRSILSDVGHMEQPATYSIISRSLARELKIRRAGEVYQYVFKLKKSNTTQHRVIDIGKIWQYNAICFIKETNDFEFDENKRIVNNIPCRRNITIDTVFNLIAFTNVREIRLAPLNTNCIIKIKNILLGNNLGNVACSFTTNGTLINDNIYIYNTDQPYIYLQIPSKMKYCNLRAVYDIIAFDDDMINDFTRIILPILEK